jgi:hypothetical protein
MANSFLFYQNRTYGLLNNETGIGIINFDLELTEGHSMTNSVTRYNVEDGADVSDHIQNELEAGTVSGFVSNFSIFDGEIFENKAQFAYDTLQDLWKKKQLVDIYTILRIYEGVAITSININRDASSGESLICNISFQEFNKIKLSEVIVGLTVNLKDTKTTQNKQASPTKNVGKQQGTTASNELKESLLNFGVVIR